MMLKDYLNQLKNKYNYDNDLIELLSKIIPSLIRYYGEEYQEQILNALYNCEIHIQKGNENANEYLNNYFGVNEKWNFPIGGVAFCESRPRVENNNVFAKNIIFVCKPYNEEFDLTKEENIATIVHEICHLVKGFGRMKIRDEKIISTTGLMSSEFDFDGKVLNGDYSINVGIEEALNCYDEEKIMSLVLGQSYESKGYHGISKLVEKLMQHEEISTALKKARFNNNTDWIYLIGEEKAAKLIEDFDTIIKTSYISNKDIEFDEDAEFDRLLEEGKDFEEIQEIIMKRLEEERDKIWEPYNNAYENIENFIQNFTSKNQLNSFANARVVADKKVVETLQEISKNIEYQSTIKK